MKKTIAVIGATLVALAVTISIAISQTTNAPSGIVVVQPQALPVVYRPGTIYVPPAAVPAFLTNYLSPMVAATGLTQPAGSTTPPTLVARPLSNGYLKVTIAPTTTPLPPSPADLAAINATTNAPSSQ